MKECSKVKERIVLFETAVLANKCGLFYNTKYYYNTSGKLNGTILYKLYNKLTGNKCYNAPSQHLLQKWLRDVHNIHIQVLIHSWMNKTYYYKIHCDKVYIPNSSRFLLGDIIVGDYEYVLDKALHHALNLIKKI